MITCIPELDAPVVGGAGGKGGAGVGDVGACYFGWGDALIGVPPIRRDCLIFLSDLGH